MTKLDVFLRTNAIKPAHLAREAAVSRSYIHRLRSGEIDPTRHMMLKVRDACSHLLARTVYVGEVFDLGDAVTLVTAAHGDRFAEEWYRGEITDACDLTGIVRWPEDGPDEAEDRFHDVTDEICLRVFESVRTVIAEAFVRVATDVLTRERGR